jgi:hypothetical protein
MGLLHVILMVMIFVSGAGEREGFSPFDRLVGGEWVIGFETGHEQVDHWRWGPGKRSIIGHTHSTHEHGETTIGALRVIYRDHVQADGVLRFFALSAGGIVTEGAIQADGDRARMDVMLHYSEALRRAYGGGSATRAMVNIWSFAGDGSYVSRLLESIRGREQELVAWEYRRREAPKEHVVEPVKALTHFKVLTPWLALDGAVKVDAVAHTQALLVRRDEGAEEGVFYFHDGRGALRYLGLRADGSVVHGDVVIEDGPVVRIELDGDAGEIELREGDDGVLGWVQAGD